MSSGSRLRAREAREKGEKKQVSSPGAYSMSSGFRLHQCSQLENNYFTEICSGSEAGSYLRLIDFGYPSTLGLRVIQKKIGINIQRIPSESERGARERRETSGYEPWRVLHVHRIPPASMFWVEE